MSFIIRIAELDRADLLIAGGKGSNLGALLRAGLPVPDGFVITTAGYRAFVAENHLDADLRRILVSTQMDDPAALKSASGRIRSCFSAGQISPSLENEIRQAYLALGTPSPAVAVRSSATAEDLPDLSFAGQQDTYLNILGEEALLKAVVCCWASLWTARAIGYRARNSILQAEVALAVVVQRMVQSEASGVLFTANPLSGKLSETVIDATFGLGEALVSGQVEPDHYVVETAGGRILSKTLGAKALRIEGQTDGGTMTISQDGSTRQAIPDEQILLLARLGRQAAVHFGSPQDMEWAWAKDRLYVVQSRPITSLYPLPEKSQAEPLEAWFSFGVWQGMLDPFTPLGQDIFTYLVSGLGEMAHVIISPADQRTLLPAGERLFVNISSLLRNPIGRQVANIFIASVDPISGNIIDTLLIDPRFSMTGSFSPWKMLPLIRGVFPFGKNILTNLLSPARGRQRLQNLIDRINKDVKARCARAHTLSELVEAITDTLTHQVKDVFPTLVAAVASGQGMPLQTLIRMSADVPHGPDLIMEMTRGLPYNVTTEMGLALWETAKTIRAEPDTAGMFTEKDVADLVASYRSGTLPAPAQQAIVHFLDLYGMRGVGEIDIGCSRWEEDPSQVFRTLKSYLQMDESRAPDVIFRDTIAKAQQAEKDLIAAFAARPAGWIKSRQARMLADRFRELGGLRESPKFAVIQILGIYRSAFLASGRKLVEQGMLNEPEDIFYLHLYEMQALASGEIRDWGTLVAEHRTVYQRELRRKRIPHILLSDGTAYYDAISSNVAEDENTLTGNPVSAGTIEGTVHVVLDPHGAQLLPGEVLVCPATDPAWTPLFLSAGGLVMEVGGMMTHGSVVAREYGIPAVVGVREATERLKTGQRVRVDGSSGRITILSE
jgi:rifampicin phosphotransferase